MNSEIEHCRAQIARYDRDRYFVSLFTDRKTQPGLWALYAFNLEVASIAERVSESLLGFMRLAWWQDGVKAMYAGDAPRHQTLKLLAPLVQERGLDYALFENILQSREADFETQPFSTEAELYAYLKASSGGVFRLAFAISGEKSFLEIADELGMVWGLTGLLRATPFLRSQNREWLPPGTEESYFAAQARERMRRLRGMPYRGPARAQLLFADLAALDLKRLEEKGYDSAPSRKPLDIWRLVLAHWIGKRVKI